MQRSYYLMREVARHHEVQVVAFRQHAHQPDEQRLEEAKSAVSEFATIAHVANLPEDRMAGGRAALALRSLLPGPPYTIRWGLSEEYARAVKRAIEEFEPDLLHFDTISLAPYLDLASQIPAVLNHHNIESHMLLRRAERERNLLKRFYFWQEGSRLARYERHVAHRFVTHLVCAELDAERLIATAGVVPTEVVPNGVDLNYFYPAPVGTRKDAGSMLFVGGLSWYPNASAVRFFLNEVWPILTNHRPDIEFRLIGRNPPPDILSAASNDSRIRVLGFVDDIHSLFHTSMVYVCPIFDGGGTKLKMLDAMAMGKAIVAHPVACEGLGLTHALNVLEAATPEDFAQKILEVLENSSLRNDLEARARIHAAENFSFSAIGMQLSVLYSTISRKVLPSTGEPKPV